MTDRFEVEVAYALPDKQYLCSVLAKDNMTVLDAIERSGILKKRPEINLKEQKVGIFSRIVPLEHIVRAGIASRFTGRCSPIPKKSANNAPSAQNKKVAPIK